MQQRPQYKEVVVKVSVPLTKPEPFDASQELGSSYLYRSGPKTPGFTSKPQTQQLQLVNNVVISGQPHKDLLPPQLKAQKD